MIQYRLFGPLAQLVEQVTLNHLVEGSNPSRPTKYARAQRGLFYTDFSVKQQVWGAQKVHISL
jgi:hypothetical protein